MQVLDTIMSRSMIAKVSDERPSREQIEKLLDAAVRAPNHYLTQPWRFFVLTGEARSQLGDLMAEALAKKLENPSSEQAAQQLAGERAKALRAPVVIVVGVTPARDGRAIEVEEIAATAAAVENMLLAAQAMGLGAYWRTGSVAYDVSLKRWLGLRDDDHVLAIVYVGYPASPPRQSPRKSAREITTWLGWED